MTLTPRLQRAAATFAVVTGAGLFGLALGGVASVDGELRAATTQPAIPAERFGERVVHRPAPGGCSRDGRPTLDLPATRAREL